MRTFLVILLIVLSAILLFWRLDGAYLWRDEATTANWARVMVERNRWMPYVVDGDQLVVQAEDGHDFNSQFLPAMQSWLQFYVAAAGFKLFGVDTLAARLPFAIAGGVCVFVWYRLGSVLCGSSLQTFLIPYLGLLSIFFLTAARQCRYYVLVVLGASLLLLEFCRYLRDPNLSQGRVWYLRVGLWGTLLYFSNYVSFVGTWAALTLFVLTLGDRRLIRGFLLLSAGMAVVFGLEFWAYHSEFAEDWPPPEPESTFELYRSALVARGRDLWRTIPLLLLVPCGFFLYFRRTRERSTAMLCGAGLAVLLILSPILLGHDLSWLRRLPPLLFLLGAVLGCVVPFLFLECYRRLPSKSLWVRVSLLAALVLLVSPVLTIAAGANKALTRHYYQILPAALLLGATATAGLERAANRAAASAFFAGLLLWPNLSFNFYGTLHIAERQWFRDQTYTEPLIHYLRERVDPGAKVAFFRNVKGMTVYFYMPQIRWVALLDSEAPHNRKFRGRLPDDQFDDYRGAEWYVVWDPRGGWPKVLDERFEKVWEYTYSLRQSWWDRQRPPRKRSYRVFRRVSEEAPGSGAGAER